MILVTGGTGAMGSVLVRKLAESGARRIRILTVPGDPNVSRLDGIGADIRYGDISCANDLEGICDSVSTVFHLAAIIIADDPLLYDKINTGGTRNIVAEATRAGVTHFVHVSSASVLYPKPTAYSLSKRAGEKIVTESAIPYTIVRPTLVYGKRGGQEFDMYLAYLRTFPVVPFIGSGDALKRPVFVEDIIDGLVKIEKRGAQGSAKTYNFSGGKAISMIDFTRLCLVLMGKEHKSIAHLPVWFCKVLATALQKVMRKPPLTWSVIAGITQDANLDPSEAIQDLGYAPSSVAEKLPQCFPR